MRGDLDNKILIQNYDRNMKVIFVGIHNKPGKKPLCSTTVTGLIVDRIISQIGDVDIEKKNLFPVEYMPNKKEANQLADSFEIEEGALYVGLGKVVNDYIGWVLHPNFISIHHPGYLQRQGKVFTNAYIIFAGNKILSNLN